MDDLAAHYYRQMDTFFVNYHKTMEYFNASLQNISQDM